MIKNYCTQLYFKLVKHYLNHSIRSANVKTIFDLWYDGNPAKRIAPYYCFRGYDMFKKGDNIVLSKASSVMNAIYEEAKIQGKVTRKTDISALTKVNRDKLFEEVYLSLCRVAYDTDENATLDKLRIGEKCILTIYEKVCKPHRKKRTINEMS